MSSTETMSIAITGGAGKVGTALREVLSPHFKGVRIVDLAEPAVLAANETWRPADISNLADLIDALQGVDGVVHLAGFPGERPIEDILHVNVLGSSNVYEASRLAGIGRVVLGSSNHVVGFYPRDIRLPPDAPMRPDGLYALSKCWAELTAGLYYEKCGIRTLVIRIGNAQAQPTTARSLEIWISPGDLAQLISIGLTHPDVDCTTVYGVSAGGGSWWDNSVAEALGYVAQDRIVDYAHPDAFGPQTPDRLPEIAEYFQGGLFCSREHDGTLRILSDGLPRQS